MTGRTKLQLTNKRTEKELAIFLMSEIWKKCGAEINSPEFIESVDKLELILKEKFANPILPIGNESLAFSVMTPKTAALAYERVYRIPVLNDPVPEEIGFYGASIYEKCWWAATVVSLFAKEAGVNGVFYNWNKEHEQESGTEEGESEKTSLGFICTEFPKLFYTQPTIFYHSQKHFQDDFSNGKQEVLTSAISNIAMVQEAKLNWEQVIEFRKDKEARIKYIRLTRWIDNELLTKPKNQIEDEIAIKLDDYNWTIKKHGIQTAIGTLSSIIDAKFLSSSSLATTAAALTGGGLLAALTSLSLLFGKTAITFGSKYIENLEKRRKDNFEIAYLFDIKKKFS
jgi:hypothetical protein